MAVLKFKVGDIICSSQCPGVLRRIKEVGDDFYVWEYPDIASGDRNEFDSRNSTDPELVWWELYNAPLNSNHGKVH